MRGPRGGGALVLMGLGWVVSCGSGQDGTGGSGGQTVATGAQGSTVTSAQASGTTTAATTTTGSAATSTTGSASTGSGGAGGGGTGAIQTVFVIVMENEAWCALDENADAPYLNGLVAQNAFATNYTGPNGGGLHPSEPNYIWMEAGDNLGITTDDDPAVNHQATTDHLVTHLDEAGISWRAYQQSITGDTCPLEVVGAYHPKHNPTIYFDDVTGTNSPDDPGCIAHNRPLTELETDLAAGTVAHYNFITPDQCNDMHDSCAPLDNDIAQGDAWLAEWIPKIQASPQYQAGGAIFITWDESESTVLGGNFCCVLGNCPIGMIVLSPFAKPAGYKSSIAYDHSSLLKTVQEIFGSTPLLRHAGDPATNDLSDLFATFP